MKLVKNYLYDAVVRYIEGFCIISLKATLCILVHVQLKISVFIRRDYEGN